MVTDPTPAAAGDPAAAAAPAGQIRIGLDDPLRQIPADYWIYVDPANTPINVEDHLITSGHLNGQGPNGERLTYAMACNGRALVRDETLGAQGVTDGAVITVNTKNIQG